jgi:hypothetical protein
VLGLTASPGGDATLEGTGELVAALARALGAQLVALDDAEVRAAAAAAQAEADAAKAAAGAAKEGAAGAAAAAAHAAAGGQKGGCVEDASAAEVHRGGLGLRCSGLVFTQAPCAPLRAVLPPATLPLTHQTTRRQGHTERALTLPMREVDGEVWRSLLLALLRGVGRFYAALQGARGGLAGVAGIPGAVLCPVPSAGLQAQAQQTGIQPCFPPSITNPVTAAAAPACGANDATRAGLGAMAAVLGPAPGLNAGTLKAELPGLSVAARAQLVASVRGRAGDGEGKPG